MNMFSRSYSVVLAALSLAGCGEPHIAKPMSVSAKPFRAAGDFNDVGKVSLSEGESCASQIMFIFHGARPVSMAAPFHVSKILTEASHDHKTEIGRASCREREKISMVAVE